MQNMNKMKSIIRCTSKLVSQSVVITKMTFLLDRPCIWEGKVVLRALQIDSLWTCPQLLSNTVQYNVNVHLLHG